ncbi:unnamed protein product [Cylicocyclus nassatus]|uniref:Uncharacterized protein n=1 Tax=Cylicocyclus nassatus TaxID=53992 RepID=A0AA36DQ41_CYLNA|nr:unnamed protein product [Cylicocyclus nassatus]
MLLQFLFLVLLTSLQVDARPQFMYPGMYGIGMRPYGMMYPMYGMRPMGMMGMGMMGFRPYNPVGGAIRGAVVGSLLGAAFDADEKKVPYWGQSKVDIPMFLNTSDILDIEDYSMEAEGVMKQISPKNRDLLRYSLFFTCYCHERGEVVDAADNCLKSRDLINENWMSCHISNRPMTEKGNEQEELEENDNMIREY